MIETPAALTDDEVRELDSYGRLTAFTPLQARPYELWEREIFWGRVAPEPNAFDGLATIRVARRDGSHGPRGRSRR